MKIKGKPVLFTGLSTENGDKCAGRGKRGKGGDDRQDGT